MAAKPARRKTAKKQQVVRKTSKLNQLQEIALLMAPFARTEGEVNAVAKLYRSNTRRKARPLKQTSLEPLAAFSIGISSKLDREVLVHRAREERADMVADGIIQPPRKAKRSKVSVKKPRRVKQQVAPTVVGLSTLRLVHDGVALVKRKVRFGSELPHVRAWKGVYPKAVVEVERKVA